MRDSMLVRASPAERSWALAASAAVSGGPSDVHSRVAAALSEAVMACARSRLLRGLAAGVDDRHRDRHLRRRPGGAAAQRADAFDRPAEADARDGEAALAAERGREPLEAGAVVRREDRVGVGRRPLSRLRRRLGLRLLGRERLRCLLLGDRRRRDRLGHDVTLGRRVGRFLAAAAREQAGDDERDECDPQRQNVTEALLPPEQVVPLPDGRHDIV